MKTLRTLAIIVAVALAAVGLALLPSLEEVPTARDGIMVGGPSDAGGAGEAAAASDANGASAIPPGADPASGGESVALPQPSATEQPVRGIHSDTGVGAMQPEASPEPAPVPAPAPQPAAEQSRSGGGSSSGSSSSSSSGGSSSGGSSSSSGGSSSGGGKSTPPRPSGVCEWDDGELQCEDDGDGDDGGDDDEEEDDDDEEDDG